MLAPRKRALGDESVEVIKPGTASKLKLDQVKRLGLGDAARGDPHAERYLGPGQPRLVFQNPFDHPIFDGQELHPVAS